MTYSTIFTLPGQNTKPQDGEEAQADADRAGHAQVQGHEAVHGHRAQGQAGQLPLDSPTRRESDSTGPFRYYLAPFFWLFI